MGTDARHTEPVWEYRGIQALRAVAALAVVFGHSLNSFQRLNARMPTSIGEFQGAMGVDVFFVISGFVMTISSPRLLTRAHPVRLFLARRLLRIAPLYWLLTLAKLVALAIAPSMGVHGRPSAWNAIASFLFIPSRNAQGEIRPVLSLGWTLNFEMAFYLLFASALPARRHLLRVLALLVSALALIGFVRPSTWPAWTSLADPIVLEFLAGAGIARLAQRRALPPPAAAAALLLTGVAGLLVVPAGASLVAARFFWWGLPASLIVLGVVALETPLRRHLPRWALLLGSASYAIYLIQSFVFPPIDLLADHLHGALSRLTPGERGIGMIALSLLLTLFAGVVVHRIVEQPIVDWLKRQFGTDRIAPIARQP